MSEKPGYMPPEEAPKSQWEKDEEKAWAKKREVEFKKTAEPIDLDIWNHAYSIKEGMKELDDVVSDSMEKAKGFSAESNLKNGLLDIAKFNLTEKDIDRVKELKKQIELSGGEFERNCRELSAFLKDKRKY
jgi:hypothetical protein